MLQNVIDDKYHTNGRHFSQYVRKLQHFKMFNFLYLKILTPLLHAGAQFRKDIIGNF